MRRSSCLLCVLLLALSFASAHAAATSPPGVNLRWDNCYGDGGVQFKNFACNTNVGSEALVGSFELAQDEAGLTGIEFYVSIGTAVPTLPAWWRFLAAGACRQGAVSAAPVPPAGASQCTDWSQGQAGGGLAASVSYLRPSFLGGGEFELLVGGMAVPSTAPANLVAGQEYFFVSLRLGNSKTVGTGACGGCLQPACIFLSAANLVFGTTTSMLLDQGANFSGSQWVSWQMGYPLNIIHTCQATGGGLFCLDPSNYFDVVPYSPTPARTSTWSAVKALYR